MEVIKPPTRPRLEDLPSIYEDDISVSYLGVRLKKAEDSSSDFVPKKENYADYINEEFSLELQKKIAISLGSGDPILIEGGTSIGKTTTIKKMCAQLGYEVHYINLNGATDVEDLMGRYIPNPHKKGPEDPEYIFADGKITSGLRQEDGKIKVIVLDELGVAAPNILIRLHEVLDALERGGDVVLSEEASRSVSTNKARTKIIALTNPPGKGFFNREPLDPAQLRRWVYQKEATDLPDETFSVSTDALFNLASKTQEPEKEAFLVSPDQVIQVEQLAEIPGIQEIIQKYKEFHKAAKEMLKNRQIAADQPQPFSFDDRMEPKRVRDFVLRFYNGDINQTFQEALRYYYANKLESDEDKETLGELIRLVECSLKPLKGGKRKGTERKKESRPETKLEGEPKEQIDQAKKIMDTFKMREQGKTDVLGPAEIEKAFGIKLKPEDIPPIPFSRKELERAKKLRQYLILRVGEVGIEKKGIFKISTGTVALTMKEMHDMLTKQFEKDGKDKISFEESRYKDEEFFTTETPELSWALTTKTVLGDGPEGETYQTLNKNTFDELKAISAYVQDEAFKDKELPSEYEEAIKELESQISVIQGLIDASSGKEATQAIQNLKLTQLTLPSPVEVLYDFFVYFKNNDERLLENLHTRTRALVSDGRVVFGVAVSKAVYINCAWDSYVNSGIGVSFSRAMKS